MIERNAGGWLCLFVVVVVVSVAVAGRLTEAADFVALLLPS